jgi:aflatoxin B1 aldehyde reductase
MYTAMYDKPSLREGLKMWDEIGKNEGVSKAELAYRWVAHHSALTEEGDAVIFGASKLSQIEQTAGGIRKGKLSDKESIDQFWEFVKADAPST